MRRAFSQSPAEAEKTQTLLERERALAVHLILSLMEGTLPPTCTWTGVNDAHQYVGFPELVCIILCLKISLVLLNQYLYNAARMHNAGRVTEHVSL